MTREASERKAIFSEIEAMCSIGIHEHERANPQRVLITVELTLDAAKEPCSDQVDATLDFDAVRDAVAKIVAAAHYDLQETLARRLVDQMLTLRDVTGVIVTTSKPEAYPDCRAVSYRLAAGISE